MDQSPLRVVMSALTFVPGHMGGSETYARSLATALAGRSDVHLTTVVTEAAAGLLAHDGEVVVPEVTGGARAHQRVRTLVQAARRRRALPSGVVHYPFTVPLPGAAGPWVTSLLDVQHRDLPDMFGRPERWYRTFAYDGAARRASRVLTISEFARERIVATLGVDPALIDVAPLGVDRTVFTPEPVERLPFVYYPAAAWPHKNHEGLLAAMEILRRGRPEVRLVLSGGMQEQLGPLPAWAEHRGHLTGAEVLALYRSAACLAYPSRYEGFGLPPLEAMAVGTPVAASAVASIPEVCGNAAILFDPDDPRSIAAGVEQAIGAGDRLRDLGLKRAAEFTWERCAEAHVASYRAAAR
ncbi:MAG: glycosyltransferase family 4 protein [Nocardioidaceae bacterium]|nr:glycosyltransferase family 4 protein [Nocardioidaceae bacterium]